jgi:nucleotidyltransferase AbiEii toxin of type IV toxin-antitoxin system
MPGVETSQESENTLVVSAAVPSGRVKVSFFGGMGIDRVNDPLETQDAVLIVASLEDLLATKLKATLDRAEAKDYRDIAALLEAGTSLERGLGAFAKMYGKDPALVLRAIGFFKDGDLPSLSKREQDLLRAARDRVTDIPEITLKQGLVLA